LLGQFGFRNLKKIEKYWSRNLPFASNLELDFK
jgi:hypothetical protein